MPVRATVADVRFSRYPTAIGLCSNDLAEIIPSINECTQRLLQASGETGWWGCWARVRFPIQEANPYLTLPRQFARIINMDVCKVPVRIHNAFYQYLPGGPGLQESPTIFRDWCGTIAGYEANPSPTMRDIDKTNQLVRIYPTNSKDVGKRVLITGLDQNGVQIYTENNGNNVNGTFLTLASPFATTTFTITQIQALQKDVTLGDVVIKQVDATTHVEVELARLAPTEINPAYRRYNISKLPIGCCCVDGQFGIDAIVKLEYVPVYQDTDQLIIANIPALIEEAQAIRYSSMDSPTAAGLEAKHHQKAIKLLQNEQRHMEGSEDMACTVNRFEGDWLCRNRVGTLT